MSAAASSRAHGNLYGAVQARRSKGLGGLAVVALLFLAAYAILFPGLLSLGGFAKFSQTWFPSRSPPWPRRC